MTEPSPEDVLQAMLNISPEDARKVRDVTPRKPEPPRQITHAEIAVRDILAIPELFGNSYPVLVIEVLDLNAVGGPAIVVRYSHGPKARTEEQIQIPWVVAINRLGSADV